MKRQYEEAEAKIVNKSKLLKLKHGENIHLNQFWGNKTKDKRSKQKQLCVIFTKICLKLYFLIYKKKRKMKHEN